MKGRNVKYNNLVSVNAFWYTQLGGTLIGIVQCQDTLTKKIKYYIGTADGFNAHDDTYNIMATGSRFYPQAFGFL